MNVEIIIILFFFVQFLEVYAGIDEEDYMPNPIENLKIVELVAKAKISDECKKEAHELFQGFYINERFDFLICSDRNNNAIVEIDRLYVGQNAIAFQHFDIILYALDFFGELMKNVWMGFHQNEVDKNREMLKYLNERCFKSVKRLGIEYCYGDILNGLKNPFKEVTELTFSSRKEGQLRVSKGQKISKLFPNVKSLKIKYPDESDWSFINGHLPFLTELIWKQDWNKHNTSCSLMIDFLKKNQQIRKLFVSNTQILFLKVLSETLPHLKILKINYLSEDKPINNTIYFNSVKELSFKTNYLYKMLDKCYFDQLDILSLEIIEEQFWIKRQWLEFISNQINPNLRTLEIKIGKLSIEQLLIIPEKFKFLESFSLAVSVECDSTFSHQDIMKFIEKFDHLSTLEMHFSIEKAEIYDLKQMLSQNWTFRLGFLYTNYVQLNIYGKVVSTKVNKIENENSGASERKQLIHIMIIAMIFKFLATDQRYLF